MKNSEWSCDLIFFSYTKDKVIQLSKKFNKSINHSEISQEHQNFITKFSNLSAFLWFRKSVKLIDLIKIFLICLHMKLMMLDALSISSILNIFEIFKLSFEFKWSKIFIIKCKHEKLSVQKAITSVLFVKNLVRAFYKIRICIIFSYLIKLLEKEITDLIWNQIVKNKWHINLKKSSYAIHINNIVRSEWKIRTIEKIFNI